jgi:hypothetical protein
LIVLPLFCSDSIGGSVVVGDTRWAGTFGVNADFVARTHCSIEIIASEDIEVIELKACTKPGKLLEVM